MLMLDSYLLGYQMCPPQYWNNILLILQTYCGTPNIRVHEIFVNFAMGRGKGMGGDIGDGALLESMQKFTRFKSGNSQISWNSQNFSVAKISCCTVYIWTNCTWNCYIIQEISFFLWFIQAKMFFSYDWMWCLSHYGLVQVNCKKC